MPPRERLLSAEGNPMAFVSGRSVLFDGYPGHLLPAALKGYDIFSFQD